MRITIQMSAFGSHGCGALATWKDGAVYFSGSCTHRECRDARGHLSPLYSGAAEETLQEIAEDPNNALWRERYQAQISR